MVDNLLSLMLARMNLIPSILSASELRRDTKDHIDRLEARGILRPAKPSDSFACPDCGRLCQVHFETHKPTKTVRGYISCPECGLSGIDLSSLKRWAIDVEQLLVAIFDRPRATVLTSELVPGGLWRIGKANWQGRPRELLFARCNRRNDGDTVAQTLKRRPKSLLFVPTESDATSWVSEVPNTVIALQSVVSFGIGCSIQLDDTHIEGQIAGAEAESQTRANRPTRRRASRTADIDALERELIKHIKVARDHAVTSRDKSGEAKLLPRPSKENLGKLASVKPYSVSRCFHDSQAQKLRLLWDVAADLDQIITYRD